MIGESTNSTHSILGSAGGLVLLAALVVATISLVRERWGMLVLALVVGSLFYTLLQDPVGSVVGVVRWLLTQFVTGS